MKKRKKYIKPIIRSRKAYHPYGNGKEKKKNRLLFIQNPERVNLFLLGRFHKFSWLWWE